MLKDKVKLSLLLIGLALVIGFFGYLSFTVYTKSPELSYNELTKFINKIWFKDKPINFTIELEKDVDDLHLLLLSYQQGPNSGQQTGLAAFKRLPNGKYKYDIFVQCNTLILTANEGTSFVKNYGFFSGILTDNQPTKYLITVDGKQFTDTFEKNQYFIRVYDLNNQSGFSMAAINN